LERLILVDSKSDIDNLNEFLEDKWKVKMVVGVQTGGGYTTSAWVVIEKEEIQNQKNN
jgi:hypothetical protein